MSGSNNPQGGLITLDELERLIRILGMLGSSSDGEVVAAARFATKWVTEHATDWKTLLSPPEEALPVTGVVAVADPDEAKTREAAAYRNGYAAGMRDMGAQLKAQAAAMAATPPPMGGAWTGLGAGLGGPGGGRGSAGAQAAQGPLRPSGGLHGQGYAQGTWQRVCQDLLDRHAQGIPGVFRGAREADFVADMLGRGFPTLTPAQDKWLRDIAGRAGISW